MKRIFLNVFFVAMAVSSFAQKTQVMDPPYKYFSDALELYKKEKYSNAMELFQIYSETSTDEHLKLDAVYYIAASALALNHSNAVEKMESFISEHPKHPKAIYAHFLMGRSHYNNERWSMAAKTLKESDEAVLTSEEVRELHFMLGYSYFKQNKFEEAADELAIIKNDKTKYYFPANYYLGYISLKLNKPDEALVYFNNIKGSKIYGPEVPLYISQIYFSKKDYDKVISYTDTLSATSSFFKEIQYLRGKSFYYKTKFSDAITLLETNKPAVDKMTPEDHYMLGYSYMMTGNYRKAYPEFTEVYQPKDSITQYAYYHSGQSFIKLDMKTNARSSFQVASGFIYNKAIAREALFNYGKLSYELGFPADALVAFKDYANNYPDADNLDEVKTLQSEVLLQTNNYKEAIEVLESVKNMNEKTRKVYQQITYYRAIQILDESASQTTAAADYLNKSLKQGYDKGLAAKANFWLSEIAFREGKFDECIAYNKTFFEFDNTSSFDEHGFALYNTGYAYYKKKDYSTAASWFEKYKGKETYFGKTPSRYIDAVERLADCYHHSKRYEQANDNYSYAIEKKSPNADYDILQKGMILGVLGNKEGKITTLKKIQSLYPNSVYVSQAMYEIAMVYYDLDDFDEAIKGFQVLINENPKGPYSRQSHLFSGIIYFHLNKKTNSEYELKYVIENFTHSDDAKSASGYLEEIYKERGDLDGFFTYIGDKRSYEKTYKDTVYYLAAVKSYQDKNYSGALKEFLSYLQNFPDAIYKSDAYYYVADIYRTDKKYDEALPYYEKALENPKPEYLEGLLKSTATIYWLKKDYQSALPLFKRLEMATLSNKDNLLVSYLYQMRCNYELKNDDAVAELAEKIIACDCKTADAIIESNLNLARVNFRKDLYDAANKSADYVIKKTSNQQAAEARYIQASIEFKKNNMDKSYEITEEILKKYSSYNYWLAKALMLQSDIYYVGDKNLVDARAALNAIISTYKNQTDGIIEEAKAKLAAIVE